MKKGAFIEQRSHDPAVLVRLVLLADDEITGEPTCVGTFLKKVPMPSGLAGPGMTLALEIFGERRVFHPTDVFWDEARQLCIVEVVWMAADAARSLDTVKVHVSGRQSALRRDGHGDRARPRHVFERSHE